LNRETSSERVLYGTPGKKCIYWTDINGFKISREKAERVMERLLARTSKDFQFSIRRQPAGGTQARHRKKRKEMVQE
jgi:hypothetical protein